LAPVELRYRKGDHVQDDQKYRVAIGVFDDLTKLNRALAEFQSFGLDTGQFALLANTGAFAGQLEAKFAIDQGDSKRDNPRLMIRGQPPHADFARGEYSSIESASHIADQLLHFENWIELRFSDDLNDHLAQGACVLIAPITTAQLEWLVSKTLLKYSVSSVQLHDLAMQR
jgi:hypothetical protein